MLPISVEAAEEGDAGEGIGGRSGRGGGNQGRNFEGSQGLLRDFDLNTSPQSDGEARHDARPIFEGAQGGDFVSSGRRGQGLRRGRGRGRAGIEPTAENGRPSDGEDVILGNRGTLVRGLGVRRRRGRGGRQGVQQLPLTPPGWAAPEILPTWRSPHGLRRRHDLVVSPIAARNTGRDGGVPYCPDAELGHNRRRRCLNDRW